MLDEEEHLHNGVHRPSISYNQNEKDPGYIVSLGDETLAAIGT